MIVFDVYLNGRKLYRAGVKGKGVLNAMVTWVRYSGPPAERARRLGQPLTEMRLQVGGLAADTDSNWPDRKLKVGDRVAIKIVAADNFDSPTRQEPRDPNLAEQAERRHYLRLKRKYEPDVSSA